MPVANSQQAVNQTVNGGRVRSKIVPPVTEVRPPHPEHMNRPLGASPPRAAAWAGEAGGPSEPLQVVDAIRIGPEPRLKLANGPRRVRASPRVIHPHSLLRFNGYPHTGLTADLFLYAIDAKLRSGTGPPEPNLEELGEGLVLASPQGEESLWGDAAECLAELYGHLSPMVTLQAPVCNRPARAEPRRVRQMPGPRVSAKGGEPLGRCGRAPGRARQSSFSDVKLPGHVEPNEGAALAMLDMLTSTYGEDTQVAAHVPHDMAATLYRGWFRARLEGLTKVDKSMGKVSCRLHHVMEFVSHANSGRRAGPVSAERLSAAVLVLAPAAVGSPPVAGKAGGPRVGCGDVRLLNERAWLASRATTAPSP